MMYKQNHFDMWYHMWCRCVSKYFFFLYTIRYKQNHFDVVIPHVVSLCVTIIFSLHHRYTNIIILILSLCQCLYTLDIICVLIYIY